MRDPIGAAIFVVLAVVFWFAWKFVTDRTSTDDGEEFGAAKTLFVVFLVLAVIGVGIRNGIKVVFNV